MGSQKTSQFFASDSELGTEDAYERFAYDILIALRTAIQMSVALYVPEEGASATPPKTIPIPALGEDNSYVPQRVSLLRDDSNTAIATEPLPESSVEGKSEPLNEVEQELRMFYVTQAHKISCPGNKTAMVVTHAVALEL